MARDGAHREWIGVSSLVLLAAALRLHGLGSQLWLDEIDAVVESIRRPALEIATRWPATTSHVLYDLSAHALVRWLGESALVVRLPAAAFGVAGVAALYAFVKAALDARTAFAASGLLAVSYHHVFYSQNARGYSALMLFGVLASTALLGLRSSPSPRWAWLGYAGTAALAVYSVVLGVFVLAGHGLVVLAAGATARVRGRAWTFDLRAFAAGAALAALLVAALYAPFASSLVRFTAGQTTAAVAAPAAAASRLHRLGVATEAIRGLAQGFGGMGGLAAAASIAALGTVAWAARDAFSLALLAAPVAVEAATLLALDVPLTPRYFALALPLLVVALGKGLATACEAAARPNSTRARWAADLAMALLVGTAALPLAAYYRVPKQDFLGAIAGVEGRARPGDGRIAVQYAARGLCRYYRADFDDVQSLAQLENEERRGRRLLLVTTLERFLATEAPALHSHIRSSYRRVEVLPATVGGAEMNIYESKGARF